MLESSDSAATMWDRHLLVVTADCDFAFGKNQGRVTCIPLLTAKEYLGEFVLPRHEEKARSKLTQEAKRHFTKAGFPSISDQRITEWLHEESIAGIIDAANIPPGDHASLSRLLTALQKICMRGPNETIKFSDVIEAQLQIPNSRSRSDLVASLQSAVKETFRRSPGDAIFLSSIGPGETEGYFGYLRHITQVWEPDVATHLSRFAHRYQRISRLSERFTHAVVQKFALVFLSIGLPTEYEANRDANAEYFVEGLT